MCRRDDVDNESEQKYVHKRVEHEFACVTGYEGDEPFDCFDHVELVIAIPEESLNEGDEPHEYVVVDSDTKAGLHRTCRTSAGTFWKP